MGWYAYLPNQHDIANTIAFTMNQVLFVAVIVCSIHRVLLGVLEYAIEKGIILSRSVRQKLLIPFIVLHVSIAVLIILRMFSQILLVILTIDDFARSTEYTTVTRLLVVRVCMPRSICFVRVHVSVVVKHESACIL